MTIGPEAGRSCKEAFCRPFLRFACTASRGRDLLAVAALAACAQLFAGDASASWFADPVSYSVPMKPRLLAVGNINGDDRPDVVIGGELGEARNAYVYVNDGDATFSQVAEFQGSDWNWYSLAIGDFNGDGRGDVMTSGDAAKIYYQSAFGTFLPAQLIEVPGMPDALIWGIAGDLDSDGYDDLVACRLGGPAEGRILVYWGGQSGVTSSPSELAVDLLDGGGTGCWPGGYETSIRQLSFEDVDQDGDPDICFPAEYDEIEGCYLRGIGWYENLGARDFAGVHWVLREPTPDRNSEHDNCVLGGIDGDNLLDWAFSDGDEEGVYWMRGLTAESWDLPTELVEESGAPVLVDFDQDGWCELAVLEPLGMHLYEGDGSGEFADPEFFAHASLNSKMVDLDADTYLDVVYTHYGSSQFRVRLNVTAQTSGAPDGAQVEVERLVATPSVAHEFDAALSLVGGSRGSESSPSTVSVCDATGRVVRRLDSRSPTPSGTGWRWDLRDESGREVPSGVYWARVGESTVSARIVVLRDQ